MIKLINYILVFSVALSNATASQSLKINEYLSKPTGQYGIGFQDFHWINQKHCPDFNYNGKNNTDFSSGNVNHCHETIVRVYYPTREHYKFDSPYYPPAIKSMQEDLLKQAPLIPTQQVDELTQLKSFSKNQAKIVKDTKFPVLLFSPGFGCSAEIYENLITNLVSHGYIVVGINTPFINLIELPDGHVVRSVESNTRKEASEKFIPMQMQDLSYTFNQISVLHHSNAIFSAMDLKHIGAFGHSIGGKTVANTAQTHPDWFQAAVTLDIASYEANEPIKKFSIPFMHFISSYWESYFNWPLRFELNKNGFLVLLSPSIQDKHYSYHMNYSDYSTLQSLPAFKTYLAIEKGKESIAINAKIMSQVPTEQERINFKKPTYVLIKKNAWQLYYYEHGKHVETIDLDMVSGIEPAIRHLPKKPINELTAIEMKPIQKALIAYHAGFGSFLGTGNGQEITSAINTYLIQFFDTFIKGKENSAFKDCRGLSSNTSMWCGPSVFNG